MGRGDALTWENFKHTYFRAGEHRVHRINREPLIEVFGDGVASRVGLWLEVPANTQLPPEISRLIFLSSQVFDREGDTLLELVAQQESLHRTFYHFATAVANRLLNEKTSAVELVVSELACFSDLLKEHAALSVEREIGLIGELVFLRRLIVAHGSSVVSSWMGPNGDSHDFRAFEREFEVKTTVASKRVHTISSAQQLLASPGHTLLLVSVLLGAPGHSQGFSLADLTSDVTASLRDDPSSLRIFEKALSSPSVSSRMISQSTRLYNLRRPVGITPVAGAVPVVSPEALVHAIGSVAQRVEAIQYDVNIEGLVVEDGSNEFDAYIR